MAVFGNSWSQDLEKLEESIRNMVKEILQEHNRKQEQLFIGMVSELKTAISSINSALVPQIQNQLPTSSSNPPINQKPTIENSSNPLNPPVPLFPDLTNPTNQATIESNYQMVTRYIEIEFSRFDGEDLEGWLFKSERFFQIDLIPQNVRVKLAAINMEGKALQWYQSFDKNRNREEDPPWEDYVEALNGRFGEKIYEDPTTDLKGLVQTGTHEDFALISYLINGYAKCGAIEIAREVFDYLSRQDVIVWTTLMTGYVQNSQLKVAIEVFRDLLESGCFSSNLTLGIALNACSSLNSIELAKQWHAFSIKYKIDYDSIIRNALCSFCSKIGSSEFAINIFQSIEGKNVISWTTIISACGENSEAARGLRFLVEMLLEDIKSNEFTFTTVSSLCCVMMALGLERQVHLLSIKFGYQSSPQTVNYIMYIYLKYRYTGEAHKLFNKIDSTNLVTWNAMIVGYAQTMDLTKDDFSAHQNGIGALSMFLKLNHTSKKFD